MADCGPLLAFGKIRKRPQAVLRPRKVTGCLERKTSHYCFMQDRQQPGRSELPPPSLHWHLQTKGGLFFHGVESFLGIAKHPFHPVDIPRPFGKRLMLPFAPGLIRSEEVAAIHMYCRCHLADGIQRNGWYPFRAPQRRQPLATLRLLLRSSFLFCARKYCLLCRSKCQSRQTFGGCAA